MIHLAGLALAFFASGFAALVYQIVWQRLLVMFSGSDVHSATIIVAAFMAGLGCGSLAGALIADRLPRAANLARGTCPQRLTRCDPAASRHTLLR